LAFEEDDDVGRSPVERVWNGMKTHLRWTHIRTARNISGYAGCRDNHFSDMCWIGWKDHPFLFLTWAWEVYILTDYELKL
jgi:hypothetical protein